MNEISLIDKFLIFKEHSKGCAVVTVDKYRVYLTALDEHLGDVPVEKANTEQLLEFTGMHAHKVMHLSPTGRKPLIAAIRGFYAWLMESGLIAVNPALRVPYPKTGRKLPVAMQISNAEKILMMPDLNTFIGVRDLAILMVLSGCGPRVSGVCNLNEGDLVFYKDEGLDQLAIRFEEKGKNQRLVPVPMETMLMIRAYLGHEELANINRDVDGDKVLFVSTVNATVKSCDHFGEARRLRPKAIDRIIKRYGVEAGIPLDQLHAHSFRHMFGAEMAEDNTNTLIMQVLLGHADPKTTEVYAHLAMRKLRETVDKSNPLAKIQTPTSGLVRDIKRR